jgi:hypothetical protein
MMQILKIDIKFNSIFGIVKFIENELLQPTTKINSTLEVKGEEHYTLLC